MTWAFLGLVFLLGASLGSFVNVVAWRLPLSIPLSRPPSTCPACGARVALRHNVPVFGYALTRGRCHACGVPISLRYPFVELVGGLLALALWLMHAGPELPPATVHAFPRIVIPFILQLAFLMTLLALALIDLDWFLLPDRVTLPLALLGLLSALAAPHLGMTLASSALGALLGGGLPLVLGFTYTLVTGRVGLGGGDWKLLLAIGAWLGPKALPFVLLAASTQGLLAALIFRRELALAAPPPLPGEVREPEASDPSPPPQRLHIPFGPFLALGAIEWLFFRVEIAGALGPFLGGRA
jgi:leader peptidase (prepilin peptidase)/N-methyltransferase